MHDWGRLRRATPFLNFLFFDPFFESFSQIYPWRYSFKISTLISASSLVAPSLHVSAPKGLAPRSGGHVSIKVEPGVTQQPARRRESWRQDWRRRSWRRVWRHRSWRRAGLTQDHFSFSLPFLFLSSFLLSRPTPPAAPLVRPSWGPLHADEAEMAGESPAQAIGGAWRSQHQRPRSTRGGRGPDGRGRRAKVMVPTANGGARRSQPSEEALSSLQIHLW